MRSIMLKDIFNGDNFFEVLAILLIERGRNTQQHAVCVAFCMHKETGT